jgi:SAM-dependent methyltransferase
LSILPAKDLGQLFEQLQIATVDKNPKVGEYALECNNPQALCFLIDAYPTLQSLLEKYPRMSQLNFLDIGAAFGASAGLIAEMHRSNFLGPVLKVDALDIVDTRRSFIEMTYPQVNFIYSSIENLPPNSSWDFVYCSNAIEHLDDPVKLIHSIMRVTRGFAIFLAPYKEAYPLSADHRNQLSEKIFDGFNIESFKVINSAAWPITATGVSRQQMIVVLRSEKFNVDEF